MGLEGGELRGVWVGMGMFEFTHARLFQSFDVREPACRQACTRRVWRPTCITSVVHRRGGCRPAVPHSLPRHPLAPCACPPTPQTLRAPWFSPELPPRRRHPQKINGHSSHWCSKNAFIITAHQNKCIQGVPFTACAGGGGAADLQSLMSFLMQLGFMHVGRPYAQDSLNPMEAAVAGHMIQLGLLLPFTVRGGGCLWCVLAVPCPDGGDVLMMDRWHVGTWVGVHLGSPLTLEG